MALHSSHCRHTLLRFTQSTSYIRHLHTTTQSHASPAAAQRVQQPNVITPPQHYPRRIQESSRNSNQRITVHQQAPPSPMVNNTLQLATSLSTDQAHTLPYVVTKNNYHDLTHLMNTNASFTPTLQRPYPWIRAQPPVVYPVTWTEQSVRCGLIAEKLGMMQLWTHWGEQEVVSVIRIHDNYVTQIKHELTHRGRLGLQLATVDAKPKNMSKALLAHFKKAGVMPKQHVHEFGVTPDAIVPVGYKFDVRHFTVGQHVDITGYTIGKGFAGGMKRHHFAGLRASHGVSVSHRSIGATGSAQTPGKVWKGKRMPGHLGAAQRTQLNNLVYKIDVARQLLYIRGHCIGNKGNMVVLRDAVKKPFEPETPPTFPTFVVPENDAMNAVLTLPHQAEDPFRFGEE